MGKFRSERARFVASALGQTGSEAPREEAGEDWAWARMAVERIDEIAGGSLEIEPATPERMAAISRVVAREGFLISQELARASVEAVGAKGEVGINGFSIRRPSSGTGALAFKGRLEDAFDASGSRFIDNFNRLAERMAPAGMLKSKEVEATSEEAQAVAGAVQEAASAWKARRAQQCGMLIAEIAGKMLFPEPAAGRDAAILRSGAAFHRNEEGRDPLGAGMPEAAVLAANEAPHAVALFAAIAPAMLGTKRAATLKKLGPLTIMEFKELLKSEYGVSAGAWRALLDLAADSEEFPAALAAMVDETMEPWEGSQPKGSRLPLGSGVEPSEKQAEIFSALKVIAIAKQVGVPVKAALASFHPELIAMDASAPIRGEMREEELWSSLTSMLSHAPRGWRLAGVERRYDQAWESLAAKAGRDGAPKLDHATFAALREQKTRPEAPGEAHLMALENDRIARAEKGPTLVASAMRWANEPKTTQEERRQVQHLVDFLHGVELGFWSQAPAKISMGWLLARSQEWHDAMAKAKAGMSSWTPATQGEIDCGNGWKAVELSTGEALANEGREMSHCVSGYAKACSEGVSRIFSLRSESSGQRSTIEMSPEWKPNLPRVGIPLSLSIVQHMGAGNSDPSIMAKAAARRMTASIAEFLSEHAATAGAESKARRKMGKEA